MALRSHILSAFRFADYSTGETTLAREIWREVPENSLTIVDRNFLIAKELIHLEHSGRRHWLSRAKTRTRYAVIEKLGRNDALVSIPVKQSGLPDQWVMRAITYRRRASTIDAAHVAARPEEVSGRRAGRGALSRAMGDRDRLRRAQDPPARTRRVHSQSLAGGELRQELWGIAIAYNLVRMEMARTAAALNVAPTRISFVASLFEIPTRARLADRQTNQSGNHPRTPAAYPTCTQPPRHPRPPRAHLSARRQSEDEQLPA